ncbi:hypothetical protein [Paenibacillus odorifer]|uniref:hypothetical protein n=1 Tax=Paenibacillus odorifer TaxID=189426 RepID=UPI0004F656D7|nr:hypothetical protein [Paenibacillus odorifer]AIQ73015.1 hypothetical protein PODO_06975 [Paenibacillus odorifer]
MKEVKLSIDRIVVDFTDVFWEFFNPFQQRIRECFRSPICAREKGFKYHLHIRNDSHYLHISYQLCFVKKSRKNTMRIECHPESLVHFSSLLSQIADHAKEILFVRCDVAFDIPIHISKLLTLSLTGRNMHSWMGTRYSNKRHQRQVAGYCRVYNKKNQLLQRFGKAIKGELTRFEIVYAPNEKIPLNVLVQFPPEFNRLYFCAELTTTEQFKPKEMERIQGLMSGELEQKQVTGYYRRSFVKKLQACPTLDFDQEACKQWKDAITIPCAVLGGVISHVA